MSGKGFVRRWALRVVRREWRQHFVILVFITTGVAVSVTAALAAYNLVEPPESAYGNAQFAATSPDPEQLQSALDGQDVSFARLETSTLGRDQTTESVTVKVIDPENSVSAPLFTLLAGAWPQGEFEIALTDRAVSEELAIGSTITLDGQELRVVGKVENPTALSDEFGVVSSLDGFPSGTEQATIEFLVDARSDDVDFSSVSSLGINSSGGPPVRTTATLVVNVVSAFGMLEVGLLVGSSFAVIARRRSRQYGLLAAAGAPPSLIRSAAASVGAILGVVGASIGLLIGIVAAWILVPSVETAVGHRITFALPIWAIAPSALIGIAVATYSARRPAVALTRLSIVDMLASTRPQPEPTGRAAFVGVILTVLGVIALISGFARLNLALALVGTLLSPIGLLLLAPLVVRMLGALSAKLPLAERLIGRTIDRYNRRSAAVVAALALALAIPVAVAVVSSSIDARASDAGPNLAEDRVIIWAEGADGFAPRTPATVDDEALAGTREAIQSAMPDLSFVPIEVAVPVEATAEMFEEGLPEVPIIATLTALDAECTFCDLDSYGFQDPETGEELEFEATTSWVGSAALMEALDLDSTWLDEGVGALVKSSDLNVAWYEGILAQGDDVHVAESWPVDRSVPASFVAPGLVDDRFRIVTVGFLGSSPEVLSAEQRETILAAAVNGSVLEFNEPPEPRSALRVIALIAGLFVALGVTVSAGGLLQAELATDRGLLSSLGARPRTSQRMAAAGAGLLALAGAALAVLIGYVPLLPMIASKADDFPFVVPWLHLATIVLLFPAIAAGVAWLSSRRSALAPNLRQSI